MKKLLILLLILPSLVWAQDETKFMEIEGRAMAKVQPDNITADIVISSMDYYDTYNEKELSKFENSLMKTVSKLRLDEYFVNKDGFIGSCSSFEKEFALEFDNVEEYNKLVELIDNTDFPDVYVDFYLNDYSVSDEVKADAYDELFIEAIENAKSKAEQAAEVLGVELGSPISLQEQDDYYWDDDYWEDDYYGYDYDYDLSPVKITKVVYYRVEIN